MYYSENVREELKWHLNLSFQRKSILITLGILMDFGEKQNDRIKCAIGKN